MIRPMTFQDLQEVVLLSGQLGYPLDMHALGARFQRLRADENRVLLVFEDPGNGVVGWVHAHIEEGLLLSPRTEIRALIVGEEHRRKGIGKALVRSVEAWTKEIGMESVFLRTNESREGAHQFYKNIGYKKSKTSYLFTKDI